MKPPLTLTIIGAGGYGIEVLEIARRLRGETADIFVIDDDPHPQRIKQVTLMGGIFRGCLASWNPAPQEECTIAIGSPDIRRRVSHATQAKGVRFATLVHPDSTIASSVSIGEGSIISPGVRIAPGVTIGSHVQIDQNATIGHDAQIGDYARLCPMACVSGAVTIGRLAYVGANATILQQRNVANSATVGAGAVVTKDVPTQAKVKGVPAK